MSVLPVIEAVPRLTSGGSHIEVDTEELTGLGDRDGGSEREEARFAP